MWGEIENKKQCNKKNDEKIVMKKIRIKFDIKTIWNHKAMDEIEFT